MTRQPWWDETGPDGHPCRELDRTTWTDRPAGAARPGPRRGRRRRTDDSLAGRLRYALLLAALAVAPAALCLWGLGGLR
ncbi:hypothetical protein [Candidatus Frankia alpina]|uniref:hypothetical protein n=1 Tax=Candidatus Frankia alpina TaxID=2699483 RepID=UPI0013D33B08|nr:hypothetical protein [Candidatus Frankia alpina]